jgi:hypothetical protein
VSAASFESPVPAKRPKSGQYAAVARGERPREAAVVHTHILRCTLAADDCYAYWQRVRADVPVAERARVAFEERWFGTKSEARVRTLVANLVERFDAYPDALGLLTELEVVPAAVRPLLCHLHTQLSDPIYRRFAGDLLPSRREQGLVRIDRDTVARWVDASEPGRWSSSTVLKFASNLLATAYEAGLVEGRTDPRKVKAGAVPDLVLGYLLYLLRGVGIEGSVTDNPYLRSLGVTPSTFGTFVARVPGIEFAELGGAIDMTWLEPSLTAWGRRYLGGNP